MDFTLEISLKNIALTQIAVSLLSSKDCLVNFAKLRRIPSKVSEIPSPGSAEKNKFWLTAQNTLLSKVEDLPLPPALKRDIAKRAAGVGCEFFIWADFHGYNWYRDPSVVHRISWTSLGTVNKKKTALIFMEDKNTSVSKRITIASRYCLKDKVAQLWRQTYFRPEYSNIVETLNVTHRLTVAQYWQSCYGQRQIIGRMPCAPDDEMAFYCSVRNGNVVSADFFFDKLTSWQKQQVHQEVPIHFFRRYGPISSDDFPLEHYTEVLCFLLRNMDQEQQLEFMSRNPYVVLKCLLYFPWQDLFMPTAERLWNIISLDSFHDMLMAIILRFSRGYKDYDYLQLFQEFWHQSPSYYKEYVIMNKSSGCTSEYFLSKLFELGLQQNIDHVLSDVSATDKESLIFSVQGRLICQRLILTEDWEQLRSFIGHCILSVEKAVELKNTHLKPFRFIGLKRSMWEHFFGIVKDHAEKIGEGSDELKKPERINSPENCIFMFC